MERVRFGTTSLSANASIPREYVGRMSYGGHDVIAKSESIYRGDLYECTRDSTLGRTEKYWIRSVLAKSENLEFIRNWQEISAGLTGLRHPGLLACLDSGKQGHVYYVIEEYVQGCSLDELWSDSNPKADPHEIIPILIDILDGLSAVGEHLRSQGRNVGPALSLIPGDIIVDRFGYARLAHLACSRAESLFPWDDLQRAEQTVGYRAPEQLAGKDSDVRAEVFSAGIILWQACEKKRLFGGSSAYASAFHVLARPIPRLSSLASDASVLFDTICQRALDRDPSQRFVDSTNLAEFLRKFVQRCYGLNHLQTIRERWGARVARNLESLGRLESEQGQAQRQRSSGIESASSISTARPSPLMWNDLIGEFQPESSSRIQVGSDLIGSSSTLALARTLAEVHPSMIDLSLSDCSTRHSDYSRQENTLFNTEEGAMPSLRMLNGLFWSIKMLMWVGLCMVVGCLLYLASRSFWKDIYPDVYSATQKTMNSKVGAHQLNKCQIYFPKIAGFRKIG